MSEIPKETAEELSKLLWCYNTTPTSEEVEKLKRFLKEHKIPPMTVLSTFKHQCEETHYRAINAVTRLASESFERGRQQVA